MIEKKVINDILKLSINEVLKNEENIDLYSDFIGKGSNLGSLDIVEIISSVEDKLESIGYEGYDLFEKTFENESLTFNEFSNLIEKFINS